MREDQPLVVDEQLLTYRESAMHYRRVFELHSDRICVWLKQSHIEVESTIMLADLRPDPSRMLVRPRLYGAGLQIAGYGIVAGLYAWCGVELPFQELAMICAISFSIASVILCWEFRRKIEFAYFTSHTGFLFLDIGASGRDAKKFRSFVEEISTRIKALQVET